MAKYSVPELPGCLHHLLDRVAAVAPTGVRVEIAAHVQRRQQLREPVLFGRFDLVAAFPQLRRHIAQSQVAVQVVLGRARHGPARVGQRALIEHQPPALRAHLQTLYVRICAGVPRQRSAGIIRRGDEHFDGAPVGDDRDSGSRTAEHRRPPREVCQRIEHVRVPVRRRRGQQRHAIHRRRIAAQASDGGQLIDRRSGSANVLGDVRREGVSAPERNPCEWRQRSHAILSRFVGLVYDGEERRRVGEATMRRCAGGARTNPSHKGATAALHKRKDRTSLTRACNYRATRDLQHCDAGKSDRAVPFVVLTWEGLVRRWEKCRSGIGGRQEDRTPDLRIANAALSQLS